MRKTSYLSGLSEVQLEIMNVIWEKVEATVTEVWGEISKKRPVARTTIMTLMARLEEKGWLKHREIVPTYIYTATRPKEQSTGEIITDVLNKVFAGSAEHLMMTLLGHKKVSRKELARIKEIIAQTERERK
jgi:predicted transcriptional regulator